MENNFPCPIKEESDLSFYEDYIKNQNNKDCKALKKPENNQITVESPKCNMDFTHRRLNDLAYMPAYLSSMKGKLVRVESLIGGRLEARTGILMKVGVDYIVLKLFKGYSTMILEWSSVKYITVVHNNDVSKMNLL